MIFLDNASTTKIFPSSLDVMTIVSRERFFNPSALYGAALETKKVLDAFRNTIALQLKVNKNEIYFTGSATEANNWVLSSAFKNKEKSNLVISEGEHASVYNVAKNYISKGFDVRIAKLLPSGEVDLHDLEKKVDSNTSLVSVIHCSNEIGIINDIKSVCKIVRKVNPKTLIHSDGVQALCKIKNNLPDLGVDFYTISAHKIGGPKGIGALFISNKQKIAPFILGGGQESGMRSGTENTPSIAGFGQAIKTFNSEYDPERLIHNFEYTKKTLIENGWIYHGNHNNTRFILSMSKIGIKSEILQHMLSEKGILIGLGSACSSKTSDNRVLRAMGKSKQEIEGNIRISFTVNTSKKSVETAVKQIIVSTNELISRTKK
jgi:cysteine desulfurase